MNDEFLQTVAVDDTGRPKRKNRFLSVFSRDRKAQFGLVVLGLFLLGALLAPFISPYDPNEMTLNMMSKPSGDNILGTDDLGRDLFSRILWGTQISLFVGVATVSLALFFGLGDFGVEGALLELDLLVHLEEVFVFLGDAVQVGHLLGGEVGAPARAHLVEAREFVAQHVLQLVGCARAGLLQGAPRVPRQTRLRLLHRVDCKG